MHLQGCVGQLERGKQAAEEALHATQQELEEACLELEDVSDKLARSRHQLSAARTDVSEAREALVAARGQLADARTALSAAQQELSAVREELSAAKEALSTTRDELRVANGDLEEARLVVERSRGGGGRWRVICLLFVGSGITISCRHLDLCSKHDFLPGVLYGACHVVRGPGEGARGVAGIACSLCGLQARARSFAVVTVYVSTNYRSE